MKKYLPLIGIVLFLYIISKFDISQIWATLLTADIFYLLLAFSLFSILMFLRGLKWKVILSFCGIDYPLRQAINLGLIGMYMGAITPGRVGELGRAYYLKKEGHSPVDAALSVVLDRLVDFIVLSLLCIFAIFSLFFYGGIDLTFLFAVLLVMFLGIYIFFEKDIVSTVSRPLFNRFIPRDKKNAVRISFNDFYDRFHIIKGNKVWSLQIFLISLIMWFLYILQFYILTFALGIKVNFVYLAGIFPLVAIATNLPISISGLGTREVAFLFFFTKIGISSVQAISFSLLTLVFNWIPSLLGLFLWVIYSRRSE